MPSSGVLGNRDWSGNTPRAPMPKSTSLLQLSSGPNDGRCAELAAGRAAARRGGAPYSRGGGDKRGPRTTQARRFPLGGPQQKQSGPAPAPPQHPTPPQNA